MPALFSNANACLLFCLINFTVHKIKVNNYLQFVLLDPELVCTVYFNLGVFQFLIMLFLHTRLVTDLASYSGS